MFSTCSATYSGVVITADALRLFERVMLIQAHQTSHSKRVSKVLNRCMFKQIMCCNS